MTENLKNVFLEIVAAFGAAPLDGPEVKNILTQLVKEVEVGEQNRILQELKDETNNWKEGISHLTIEGIVTNWRGYEKVYYEPTTSGVTKKLV